MQWFLKEHGSTFNLANSGTTKYAQDKGLAGTAGLITSAVRGVTGFNYLLGAADFKVVLNALQGVTRVNVISSPNITVLDNRTAKLQVGDQVPTIKQSGQSALTAGAHAGDSPLVNGILVTMNVSQAVLAAFLVRRAVGEAIEVALRRRRGPVHLAVSARSARETPNSLPSSGFSGATIASACSASSRTSAVARPGSAA